VALILISVLTGVTLISIPEYPEAAMALDKNWWSSAWKTPSATNFFFLLIYLIYDLLLMLDFVI